MNQSDFVSYEEKRQINTPSWVRLVDQIIPSSYDDRVDVAGKLLSGGRSLLDVGAGESPLIQRYGHHKYQQLAAADLGSSLLKKLESWAKKSSVSVKTYPGDFLTKEIKGKYNTITALAYLEHIVSPFSHLQKMSKLLKNNGELIVEVPNTSYLLHRLDLLRGKFPTTAEHRHCIPGVDEAHLRFFTPNSMVELLEYCGFEIEVITASGRLMSLRRHFQILWPDIVVKAKKVRSCPKVSPVNQS